MPRRGPLHVWMNGHHVGVWVPPTRGAHTFHYDEAWVASPQARMLSLSLPFTPGNVPHRGDSVANFFDNLLPDADVLRRRLRARFSTASTGAFDLLTAIGRDCAGAVQLLPSGEVPDGFDRIEGVPLDEDGVQKALAAALSTSSRLDLGDAFRISLAGAQEKTALLLHEEKWWQPLGPTPTTHILKLPLGVVGSIRADFMDSVENEWLCARILGAYGVPIARTEIARFGETKVLVVERFDRIRHRDGWIVRLPQEDLCQALGAPSSLKYECDGGPGIRDVLRVLDTSSRSAVDKLTFVKAQILFWMLAAIDGHAKNFSIFHDPGNSFRLTPLYDVLSAWPIIGKGRNELPIHDVRLAMAVRSKNAHWKWHEIRPRHWSAVTQLGGLGDAHGVLDDIIARTDAVVDTAAKGLPPGFPSRVSDRIFKGLQESRGVLKAG